jgi:cytochrome c551
LDHDVQHGGDVIGQNADGVVRFTKRLLLQKTFAVLTGIAALLFFTACGQGTNDPAGDHGTASAEAARPEALYKKQCVSCHGADLEGKVGPGLKQIGSKLNEKQIAAILRDGTKGMPAFSKMLNDEEIEALARWLSRNN